jgi:hypothetical protein
MQSGSGHRKEAGQEHVQPQQGDETAISQIQPFYVLFHFNCIPCTYIPLLGCKGSNLFRSCKFLQALSDWTKEPIYWYKAATMLLLTCSHQEKCNQIVCQEKKSNSLYLPPVYTCMFFLEIWTLLAPKSTWLCSNHSFKNQTGSVVRSEKTWIDALSGFLRVAGPTNKKPEKLHKNNMFLRGYDPKT